MQEGKVLSKALFAMRDADQLNPEAMVIIGAENRKLTPDEIRSILQVNFAQMPQRHSTGSKKIELNTRGRNYQRIMKYNEDMKLMAIISDSQYYSDDYIRNVFNDTQKRLASKYLHFQLEKFMLERQKRGPAFQSKIKIYLDSKVEKDRSAAWQTISAFHSVSAPSRTCSRACLPLRSVSLPMNLPTL